MVFVFIESKQSPNRRVSKRIWQWTDKVMCQFIKDRDVFNVHLNKSFLLRHLFYHDVIVFKNFPLYHGNVFF